MDKVLTVLQVVAPIFLAVFLGICARKRGILSGEEIGGLQHFVVKICLPCLMFHSCLTANITVQALSSMLVLPFLVVALLWAFRARKVKFPYHNLPMLFACKETGMLGIPLFMILFGRAQAYHMAFLDLTQALTAYPVIAILSAAPGEDASPKTVVRQMLSSPLFILSALGLTLNLTGIWDWINGCGFGAVITEPVSFMAGPVSVVMLFCVGYNFALTKDSCAAVFRVTATHVAMFAVIGLLVQVALLLLPGIDTLTRWAALLYCILPTSYLTPGLGRSEEDYTLASGVCSITTIICLAVFCVMTAVVA